MTSPVVVDASVAAKWFLSEHDDRLALDILAQTVPIGPALLLVETISAITRAHRMGALSQQQAESRAHKAFALISSSSVVLISDATLLPRAIEIAVDIKHAVQDCLYVACAERFGGELVTVDPKLLKRASPQFPFVRRL
jgi:predicted nucleic acid-binding protein